MGAQRDVGTERVGILRAVKTPLGFFTLIVLVVDALLAGLAVKATGTDFSFLVRSAVILLFALIAVVGIVASIRPRALLGTPGETPNGDRPARRHYEYDVFVSAPMAALRNDKCYQDERSRALAVVQALKQHCGFKKVFYAGQDVQSLKAFEAADASLSEDLDALRRSRYFVLVYSRKLASSALVEAGAALALGIPSIYHVRSHKDLPFLLREAPQSEKDGIPPVHIYEFDDTDDIVRVYQTSSRSIFKYGDARTPVTAGKR